MKIILTHRYLDYDSLASMVAAQKLYPDARLVIDGSYGTFVQDFVALTKEHIPYYHLKEIDIDKVSKIILVDVNELSRAISNKEVLRQLRTVDLEIYDHHPYSGQPREQVQINSVGACTTMLVEKIKSRGLKISSFEATLMALGIYDDTGSLLFENTTSRDLIVAAFLLEQGAQLSIVAEYLKRPLTKEQMDLFSQLLENGRTFIIQKTPVYMTHAESQEYFGGLALLAHRIGEIESADIWFLVVKMENRIHIIARSRGNRLPVNRIVQLFGGAGHDKAASAVLKDGEIQDVINRIHDELSKNIQKPSLVKEIMSYPVKTVGPETTMEEVSKILLKYGHTGVPVKDGEKVIGVISRRDVDKAIKHGLKHAPVKGFMTKEIFTVGPDWSWEEVQELMVLRDVGRLPVVENGRLIGIVSRSDILRMVYGGVIPTTNELALQRSLARREEILTLLEQLPLEIRSIIEAARVVSSSLNFRVYLVGGFVRDLLLKNTTMDLDIVVEGDSKLFAEALSAKLPTQKITLHKHFGTARIMIKDQIHIDIAESRREDYDYPGAMPKVEESGLREDLYRRDFTINAMALCLNKDHFGEIIDYYGGFRDLQQGEIRFLHNLSFIEDPTRILRAIRFSERYHFRLAKVTSDAIITALESGVFNKVSTERFTDEVLQIFKENNYQKMLGKLSDYEILTTWFGSSYPWHYHLVDQEVRNWSLEKRWLVSVLHIDDQGLYQILERLRLPKMLSKFSFEMMALRQQLHNIHPEVLLIDEILGQASSLLKEVLSLYSETYAQIIGKYNQALGKVRMSVDGSKLRQLGIEEGPDLGIILKKIRQLWLMGEINNLDDEDKYLQQLIQELITP